MWQLKEEKNGFTCGLRRLRMGVDWMLFPPDAAQFENVTAWDRV